MWNLTVCGEMPRRRAAALLLKPSPSAVSTSISRGVSTGDASSGNGPNRDFGDGATRTIRPATTARNAAST